MKALKDLITISQFLWNECIWAEGRQGEEQLNKKGFCIQWWFGLPWNGIRFVLGPCSSHMYLKYPHRSFSLENKLNIPNINSFHFQSNISSWVIIMKFHQKYYPFSQWEHTTQHIRNMRLRICEAANEWKRIEFCKGYMNKFFWFINTILDQLLHYTEFAAEGGHEERITLVPFWVSLSCNSFCV